MSGTGIYKHTAGHVSVPAEGGRRQSQAQEEVDIGSTDPGCERREAAGVTLSSQRLLYLRHLVLQWATNHLGSTCHLNFTILIIVQMFIECFRLMVGWGRTGNICSMKISKYFCHNHWEIKLWSEASLPVYFPPQSWVESRYLPTKPQAEPSSHAES